MTYSTNYRLATLEEIKTPSIHRIPTPQGIVLAVHNSIIFTKEELEARDRRVAAEAWDAADRYVSMLNHGSKEFQPNKETYLNSLINK